jgi:hypothetical protein
LKIKFFLKLRNKVLRIEIITAFSVVENTIERICSQKRYTSNLILRKTHISFQTTRDTSTWPKKMSLDTNFRSRIKINRPIRIQKSAP